MNDRNAHLYTIGRPAAQLRGVIDVRLQLRAELGQVQEQVLRLAQDGCGLSDLALGVDELSGIEQAPALVALIPPRILQTRPLYHWAALHLPLSSQLAYSPFITSQL